MTDFTMLSSLYMCVKVTINWNSILNMSWHIIIILKYDDDEIVLNDLG